MPKPKRPARKKQYADLKKLQEQGLYGGRIDMRKRVSKYQQSILRKFGDVVKGIAKVLEPLHPKNYKGIFQVVRNKVIVPKRKGDNWRVNKSGNVERVRRGPAGETITQRAIPTERPGQVPPRPPAERRIIQYAVPFARKTGRGTYTVHWVRFPTWELLNEFMGEYEKDGRYQDWLKYTFEEEVSDFSEADRNAALDREAKRLGLMKDPAEFAMAGRRVRSSRNRAKSARRWQNRRGD